MAPTVPDNTQLKRFFLLYEILQHLLVLNSLPHWIRRGELGNGRLPHLLSTPPLHAFTIASYSGGSNTGLNKLAFSKKMGLSNPPGKAMPNRLANHHVAGIHLTIAPIEMTFAAK